MGYLWDTFEDLCYSGIPLEDKPAIPRHVMGQLRLRQKKTFSLFSSHAKNPLTTTCEDHHGIQLDPSCNTPTFGSSLMKIMIMAALGVV